MMDSRRRDRYDSDVLQEQRLRLDSGCPGFDDGFRLLWALSGGHCEGAWVKVGEAVGRRDIRSETLS